MLLPRPRMLILKMTLPEPRHSFRIFFFYFSLLFLYFFFLSLFFFLLLLNLWQFATIYDVPFSCSMKSYQFLLCESLSSLQYLSIVGVVIVLPSDET